ncbi:MAG TPA: hypothetical protein VHG91_09090 [Longimicrobium sp.]|nr:hypothetical protein [Longimicrobium sp.]
MAKKNKLTVAERHRQIQDSVQALPYAITQMEKEGKRGKAFILKYFSAPILRLLNKVMDRQRYKGPEGAKLKQSEKMARHLEQRRKAMEYMQGEMRKQQQKAQKRAGGKKR